MSVLSLFEVCFHFHDGGSLIRSDDGGVKFIVFHVYIFVLQNFYFIFLYSYNKNFKKKNKKKSEAYAVNVVKQKIRAS